MVSILGLHPRVSVTREGYPCRTPSPARKGRLPRTIGQQGTVPAVAHDSLPPDPFAGDPEDPALALEAFDGADNAVEEPLDDEERAGLLADLNDLAVYQALLTPRGVRGIAVDCPDCAEQHYHDWQLLRASLQQLLEAGRMRPHEPAYDPNPAGYVSWEYCRGYTDAMFADHGG